MAISLSLAELNGYLLLHGRPVDLCDKTGRVFRTEYSLEEPYSPSLRQSLEAYSAPIRQHSRRSHHPKPRKAN